MKVLVVTQQVIPHEGGLSTHVVDLLAGLRRRSHEVRLIHGGQVTQPAWRRLLFGALALGNKDRYHRAHMKRTIRALGGMVQAQLRDFRPDVVHCHDVHATLAANMARERKRLPIVETIHGPALYEYRQSTGVGGRPRTEALLLECEQAAFAAATRFIAVDSGQAAILTNDYAVDPGRIRVIFNSVNIEEVRTLARPESRLAPQGAYFLVPRRLVPKTGVQFAIEALAQVAQRDARLVIAGAGPLRGELEERAAGLGIAERVHFLGSVPRPELLPLFSRAVAVLVPSVPVTGVVEATSLAVMEAMACGSVPIASAIGGLAELIADDETGLLVPPGDATALARAMTRVLTDAGVRNRLVATGTRKVETEYSNEAWLDRILGVYQSVLEVRSAADPVGSR